MLTPRPWTPPVQCPLVHLMMLAFCRLCRSYTAMILMALALNGKSPTDLHAARQVG